MHTCTLKDRLGRKQWHRYPIATDADGTLLSWSDPLPSLSSPVYFWPLPGPDQVPLLSQAAARDPFAHAQVRGLSAFWLSAGYVLGAALQAALPHVALGGTPLLLEQVHGGAGFSYDFLPLPAGHSHGHGHGHSLPPALAPAESASGSRSSPALPSTPRDAVRLGAHLLQHSQSSFNSPDPRPGRHPDHGDASPFGQSDLENVHQAFAKLVASDLPIRTRRLTAEQARTLFTSWSGVFKLERLWALHPEAPVDVVEIWGQEKQEQVARPIYRDVRPLGQEGKAEATQGGATTVHPLLPSTAYLKALALPQWSTVTWLPESGTTRPEDNGVQQACDEARSHQVPQRMLRLRGVAYHDEKQLKQHLSRAAEAAQMDHRVLGKEQELFLSNEVTHALSPGSAFMLPHGMRVARKMERVVRDLYDVFGYHEVQTPQLFRSALWKKSGHWDNYRDDMFQVQGFREASASQVAQNTNILPERDDCCPAHAHTHTHTPTPTPTHTHTHTHASTTAQEDESLFGLKPMNCPGHCIIFASRERSYRELPIRMAEFAPLHRNESSGSLSGLTRVRRFHQDDAHVFCRPDQVRAEIQSMLRMLASAYSGFGFDPSTQIELVLSTRPAQFLGEVEEWDAAEEALRQALQASGAPWSLNAGDGAFYGPKIDCRLLDAAGRKHQTATIQLDFQLPQRFDLRYQDPSSSQGGGSTRPVMIHRAILGSVERFLAILVEHNKGRWAFWLSPRQAAILPVSEAPEIQEYAMYVRDYLALGPALAQRLRLERKRERAASDSQPNPNSTPNSGPDPEQIEHNSQDTSSTMVMMDATLPPRPAQVFHVEVDRSGDTLNKMVRRAHGNRVNFAIIVGEKEVQSQTVSLRLRGDYAKVSQQAAEAPRTQEDVPLHPRLEQYMGPMTLPDLRQLFETLDANHW